MKAAKLFPKMSYKIVRFCGDLYYEQMSEEETAAKMFMKVPADKKLRN